MPRLNREQSRRVAMLCGWRHRYFLYWENIFDGRRQFRLPDYCGNLDLAREAVNFLLHGQENWQRFKFWALRTFGNSQDDMPDAETMRSVTNTLSAAENVNCLLLTLDDVRLGTLKWSSLLV